ncbi:hypothetical protein ACHQM5_020548 [Ranunculus cassubicifolius]
MLSFSYLISFLYSFSCLIFLVRKHQIPIVFSRLRLFTAVYNGGLGLVYVGFGVWKLKQDVIPLHWWLVVLFHGVTWLFVSLVVSIWGDKLCKSFLRLWSILACLCAGIMCVFSLLDVDANDKASLKNVLDVLGIPGGVLLLSCVYKMVRSEKSEELMDGNGPYQAGFFSTMSFWWLNSLMKKGKERTLEDVDIPLLREKDRAKKCYSSFVEELNKQKQTSPASPPSILRTLIVCQWKGIVVSGFFALLKILTLSSGPLLLNAFSFKHEGYVLALSLFIAKCLESIAQRQWYFHSRLVGLQVRSLLSAAIYQKQMRLSNAAKSMHSSGEFPFWFHQTWTTSLQLCIALAILVHAVGLATIAALVVIIITVLCNTPLAKLQHKFQTKLMTAQDARLKASSEALVNMKVLKLYAWEAHFKNVIEKLRLEEYKWLQAVQLRKAYNGVLFWSSPVLVSAATFGACYFLGIPLTASNVFTFVATLRLVQDPIRSIPDVIGVIIQAKVALVRIIRFLEAPELQNEIQRQSCDMNEVKHTIYIKSADFSWEESHSKSTLKNIILELKPGEKELLYIQKATTESLPLGDLFDLTLRVVDNVLGITSTICKSVWRGNCMQVVVVSQVPQQSKQIKLLNLDDNTLAKFVPVAMNEAEQHDHFFGPLHFEELLSVNEDFSPLTIKKGNKGFFTFTYYTIKYKHNQRHPHVNNITYSEIPVMETRWLFTLDDSKADFYRFRARIAMESFTNFSSGKDNSWVIVPNPNRSFSDVDLNSPHFESLAMLSIEINNFLHSLHLTFDRVVSANVQNRCGKFYYLEFQAEKEHQVFCFTTEMYKKSGSSLLEMDGLCQVGCASKKVQSGCFSILSLVGQIVGLGLGVVKLPVGSWLSFG